METSSLTKFCKDCAWLIGKRYNTEDYEQWKCGAPQNEKGVNVVTGDKTYKIILCKDARETKISPIDFCGNEGKWYQEYKESIKVPFDPSPKKKISLVEIGLNDL